MCNSGLFYCRGRERERGGRGKGKGARDGWREGRRDGWVDGGRNAGMEGRRDGRTEGEMYVFNSAITQGSRSSMYILPCRHDRGISTMHREVAMHTIQY